MHSKKCLFFISSPWFLDRKVLMVKKDVALLCSVSSCLSLPTWVRDGCWHLWKNSFFFLFLITCWIYEWELKCLIVKSKEKQNPSHSELGISAVRPLFSLAALGHSLCCTICQTSLNLEVWFLSAEVLAFVIRKGLFFHSVTSIFKVIS